MHDLDEHSDHTPLEVVFDPEGTARSTEELATMGLTFDEDVCAEDPDETGHRRGRFKAGWRKAVSGDDYAESTLERLTWQNLGWRLGKLFGEADESQIDDLYEWCVRQQEG